MLEKICLLSISHFCIATELRFIANQNGNSIKQEGQLWHRKAVDIA
jgi:hypothetical protein